MGGYRMALCVKLVSDELAAQRGEHVLVADGGLLAVPGSLAATLGEVGLGVPAELVPADRDGHCQESEWHGAPHGPADAISGLPDAVGLGLLVDGLDHPAPVVAFDGLCCGGGGVGAGDRDVEVFGAVGVAHEGHLDRPGVKRLVPKAAELVDEGGARLAVASGEADRYEAGCGGDLGAAFYPFALQP